jgi:hypothetical protein
MKIKRYPKNEHANNNMFLTKRSFIEVTLFFSNNDVTIGV